MTVSQKMKAALQTLVLNWVTLKQMQLHLVNKDDLNAINLDQTPANGYC